MLNIPYIVTHTYTNVYEKTSFQKPHFWTQENLKHINHVKTRYRILTECNTTITYGSRVMKMKKKSSFF